jgi:hypothetical protein
MYGAFLLLFTSNEYEKLRIEHIFDSTIVLYDRVWVTDDNQERWWERLTDQRIKIIGSFSSHIFGPQGVRVVVVFSIYLYLLWWFFFQFDLSLIDLLLSVWNCTVSRFQLDTCICATEIVVSHTLLKNASVPSEMISFHIY